MGRKSVLGLYHRRNSGGTVSRALLIILGVTLAIFGLLLVVAAAVISLDEGGAAFVLMPFALATIAGGIVIVVSQVRADTERARISGSQAAIPESTVPDLAAPQSSQEGAPKAQPEPAAQTAADVPASTANDATEDVAHLVYRSTDLFATLRDLVRHELSSPTAQDKRHLADMLQAAGVMSWPDAPACEGGRLTRNSHFWIRLGTDDLTEEQYDMLIATEAALGVNQDLPEIRLQQLASPAAEEASLRLMRHLCDQHVDRPELTDEGLRVCYHNTNDESSTGDWVVRSIICNAVECVKTPFRVVCDVRVNIDEGLVILAPEIVRPRCMAIFSSDSNTQAGLARAYAFRLAVLLASHALDASNKVERVVVNCHEHAKTETLISFDISRKFIGILRTVAASEVIEEGFPTDPRIRCDFLGSWFAHVQPFVGIDDSVAIPSNAHTFPELDAREAPESIVQTCNAKRICDLGINENACRISAWESVKDQMGTTTEQAVSALVAARNSASDITVAEACNRVAQALVDGSVDLDDTSAVASLFVDGSALDQAMNKASKLLDEDENPNAEAALKILETALAPIEDMGAYLDDETYVYRYFGSVAERIQHNRTIDEGGREIRLVPDSYFNAHSNASIALGMLGRFDEALEHADICLRLAPTSTYATMRKVRVLESQSRIYEAADLIIDALRNAVTPRDAAICHYRLAYMEWKLGREDLAAACYQRSLNWDTEMSAQAKEELDDLISSSPQLERPTSEQADATLAREGIPLGCVRTDGERALAAAVACMDNGVLLSARPLMAVLYGMNNDDVVMGVYRSLSVSV